MPAGFGIRCRFKTTGRDAENRVIGHFEATGIPPKFLAQAGAQGIELPAEIFRPDVRI